MYLQNSRAHRGKADSEQLEYGALLSFGEKTGKGYIFWELESNDTCVIFLCIALYK